MKDKRFLAGALVLALAAATMVWALLPRADKPEKWTPGRGMPLPADKLIVGVLYLDSVEEPGYTFAHDEALRATQAALGLDDGQIIRKFNVGPTDPLQADHAVRDCIAQGANVIVATSREFMNACERLAAEYPDIVFAYVGGHKYNETNLTAYFGRIYQARYMSGIAAGMKTKTGKIGFVAAQGRENSEVTGGVNAFALGVESVNPDARILVRVTHGWYDPAGERQAARRLIDAGCDVIAQHCDTPNPQREAERAGVWGIGYSSDMRIDAPGAVLASVVWHWDAYYRKLFASLVDGTFSTEPFFGGLAEGMVDMTPLNPDLAEPGMAEAVAKARIRMRDGGFNVFDGVLRTNDGREVGAPGKTLDDAEIQRGMDWYHHTVAELQNRNDGTPP